MIERARRRWRAVGATVLAAFVVAGTVGGCSQPQGRGTAMASSGGGQVPDDYAAVVADSVSGSLSEIGVPGVRELDPKTAYLQGPHFHFAIEELAEVTVLEPRDRYGLQLAGKPVEPLRAGPGAALLLALLHRPSQPHAEDEAAAATASVVVAGRARSVGPLARAVDTLIAVAVEPGADATLVVNDSGRDQSINLRTGARGPDAVAGYHPVRSGNRTLVDGVEIGGGQGRFLLTGSVSARKYPYVAGRGWAVPGRVWLTVHVDAGTIAARYTCDLDAARSFTVRGSVGAVQVPATTIVATSVAESGGTATRRATVVMDVADAPVVLNANFTAQGVCRSLDGGAASFRRFDQQNQGSISVA